MSALTGLPQNVIDLVKYSWIVEFASITKSGVPLDTPLLLFYAEDLSTLDVGTGLAYPAKAERARLNPRVGMLIKGKADEPVISIAGLAAVRDRDVEANTLHYMKETSSYGWGDSQPWSIAREAVWYWSRIIIRTTPKRILWWDNPAAMDGPPHRWDAPTDTVYPASDPPPAGEPSPGPKWPQPDWRDYRKTLLDRNAVGHLTMVDEEGFPLPIQARGIEPVEDGFDLDIPAGATWVGSGNATLDFEGRATFVGQVNGTGAKTHFRFERMLPVMPMVSNPMETWMPEPNTRTLLMQRLERELDRRGQTIPLIPEVKPEPTAGAIRRKTRTKRIKEDQSI